MVSESEEAVSPFDFQNDLKHEILLRDNSSEDVKGYHAKKEEVEHKSTAIAAKTDHLKLSANKKRINGVYTSEETDNMSERAHESSSASSTTSSDTNDGRNRIATKKTSFQSECIVSTIGTTKPANVDHSNKSTDRVALPDVNLRLKEANNNTSIDLVSEPQINKYYNYELEAAETVKVFRSSEDNEAFIRASLEKFRCQESPQGSSSSSSGSESNSDDDGFGFDDEPIRNIFEPKSVETSTIAETVSIG